METMYERGGREGGGREPRQASARRGICKLGTPLAAVVPHELATDGSNDLVGYSGDEQGTPVEMKAGGGESRHSTSHKQ